MRVALLMCPMRHRENTTWFEALHNLSKGEPQFVRFFNKARRRALVDFRSYPLGPVCLATVIKELHEVRIFNFLDGDTSLEQVEEFSPHVAGFTCSTGSALLWVAESAQYLKERCGSTIVLGGPHATLDPHNSLTTTVADFVVAGEGDFVFRDLLEHIAGRCPLPERGVWCRQNGSVRASLPAVVEDLASLPVPDHSLVDQSHYCGIHIETSRGCRYSCDFCFLSGMPENHTYRVRPVESVVAELRAASKLRDLGNSKVYIVDSNFRSNERILQLMPALQQEQIRAHFWTATDIHLSEQALKAMQERGFFFLHSGVEHGSPENLPKIRSREALLSFVKNVHGQGMAFGADFILGYPGQGPSELKNTLSLARELAFLSRARRRAPKITFQPHFFRPFPNTTIVSGMIRGGWAAPQTFRGWGKLHDSISRGAPGDGKAFHRLSRRDLLRAMGSFACLNMRYQLLPLALLRLRGLVSGIFKRGER